MKPPTSFPTPPGPLCRRAFTIMEMMVAVALLAMIVTALLAVFGASQRAFRAGVNQVDVLEGGRSTTHLASRELQEIVPTGITNVVDFFAVLPDARKTPPVIQSLPGGELRTNILQDLTFVTRFNDDWYVTAYRVADSQLGVGGLYRWSAKTNYEHLYSLATNGASWMPDPAVDSRVIDGVIHFQFLAYDTNGVLIPTDRVTYPTALPSITGIGYAFPDPRNPALSNALPSSVELELGILEPQALAIFRARLGVATFDPAAHLGRRANRVHVFKQRIPIHAGLAADLALTGQ